MSLLVILSISYSFVNSQGSRVKFQSLQEGLSHQHVKCIFKDSKGFMWFGTYDGLNKFDGTNFVIYENNPDDSLSLSHNTINTIIEDKHNNIWIGTSNGLNLYNREEDNFIVKGKNERRDFLCVTTIFCDNSNNLWVGTSGNGMFLLNQNNNSLYSYTHNCKDTSSVSSNFIRSIVSDNDSNLWIGTRNGLNLYNIKENNFIRFINDAANPKSISSNDITSIALDKKGLLWIGTYGGGLNKLVNNNGINCFKRFQKSEENGSLSHNNILSLCIDKEDKLWIGTENGGLNYLSVNVKNLVNIYSYDSSCSSLNDNSIWSIYEDETGTLWVGTYDHGVNIIDDKYEKFELIQRNYYAPEALSNNNVKGFAEDNQGNLWIATDGGGICYFNTKTRQFENKIDNSTLSSKAVMTVLCDSKQNIWAGTWAGGIEKFDKNGKRIKSYKNQKGLGSGNNISCLYEDKRNVIWAGTSGNGLYMYNSDSDSFMPVIDHSNTSNLTGTSYINAILEDSYNNIWVGTLYGLVCMKRAPDGKLLFNEYLYASKVNSISSFRITSIFEDEEKNLWIGTEVGLNLFNKRDSTFSLYRKKNGLPNNTINGILEDNSGNLWLSTNKGMSKFNVSEGTFKNFFKEDGLNSNEFNANACIKTMSGEFFVGGNNGMNAFYPDSIKLNTLIPPVYITDFFLLKNKVGIQKKSSPLKNNIAETQSITLTYNQNSFSIGYVSLNYTRSLKNQYAFILEGFEKSWNYVGNRRLATYTNLDPGTYVFKVKGSNNDEVWNETPVELGIIVLPPWWKTVWAYVFYGLLFFSLLSVFAKLLVIRAKQSNIIRLERIKREKDEELNKLKLNFFANISHELRTPLTLILSPLERIMSSDSLSMSKYHLGLIYKNANRLYRLVNELMDFSKSEEKKLIVTAQQGDIVKFIHETFQFYKKISEQRNIKYQFIPAVSTIDTWFDRDKMEKILLNLISNAFKFTSNGGVIQVKVEIVQNSCLKESSIERECIKISVIDNGQGISQKYIDRIFERFFQVPDLQSTSVSGAGIGLSLVKNLVELHSGKITVRSEKWKETCFSVYLPIGINQFADNEILHTPLDIKSDELLQVKRNDNKKESINTLDNAPVILIVEDNYDLRKYIIAELSGQYKTLEAENGESGYNIAVEESPDLIVSDIVMPGKTGIDLCNKIKQDLNTSHIPIVLLTAKITLEEQIEGMQTGADAYITKPFNYNLLETTISNLIENRRKLFQRYSQDVYILPREMTNNKNDQVFLEKVVLYIDKNVLNNELSVEEISKHLLLSHSQTYRKIKALTGQSVIEFINTIRLKKAIKLFDSGEDNISEVAFKVGFNSPAYFTKCFKKQFGKTPSEYIYVQK